MTKDNSKKNFSATYTPKLIDALRATLKALPKKQPRRLTKKDVIVALKDDINRLLTDGYSYSDVCKVLKSKNFTISTATIKLYMREIDTNSVKALPSLEKPHISPSESEPIDAEFVSVQHDHEQNTSIFQGLRNISLKFSDK